jgi:acyl-CoA dehydrogenase
MHQHLLAAAVWRYRRGQPGEALLRRIAEQELVLVSNGGRDWLGSNGQILGYMGPPHETENIVR